MSKKPEGITNTICWKWGYI